MRVVLLLVATVLAMPVLAHAQQPRGGGPAQPQVARDRREAVKKRIRALRAAALADELELDERTLAKLLPTLAKWDDVIADLLKKRVDLQRRLAATDPRATGPGAAAAIDKLIDEAAANQKAFWQVEEKRFAELRKILTPAQTARLLVVLPEFERKIMNQLRRAIANPGARRARGRGLDVDVDDDFDDADLAPPRR